MFGKNEGRNSSWGKHEEEIHRCNLRYLAIQKQKFSRTITTTRLFPLFRSAVSRKSARCTIIVWYENTTMFERCRGAEKKGKSRTISIPKYIIVNTERGGISPAER